MNKGNYNELETRFLDFLKARRLRRTPERVAILNEVQEMPSHFEVEEIYANLDSKGYHVSRATVYSTIELLCQCGIVRRLMFSFHQATYELAGRNHIHLVCTECGKVREIDDPEVLASLTAMKFPSFTVAHYSTCVYGVCSRCSRKAKAAVRATAKKDEKIRGKS